MFEILGVLASVHYTQSLQTCDRHFSSKSPARFVIHYTGKMGFDSTPPKRNPECREPTSPTTLPLQPELDSAVPFSLSVPCMTSYSHVVD